MVAKVGVVAVGVGNRYGDRSLLPCHLRGARGVPQLVNRAQNFPAIAERDTDVFQVLIGQVAKDSEINAVFSKALRVLRHAEFFKPVSNLSHRDPPRRSSSEVLELVSVRAYQCSAK